MSRLTSLTPSSSLAEIRDNQAFEVVLFTKLGRNGVRTYRLADRARQPIDITGMTLKMVIKTSEGSADTELDAGMPLDGAIAVAGDGQFTVDFSLVNFVNPVSRVLVILYDDAGAAPVILAQMKSSIVKAGI